MKRIGGLKIMCFLSVLILLDVSIVAGQAGGMIFEWEPFQIRIDLALRAPSDMPGHNRIFSFDEFSSISERFAFETIESHENTDRNLNILKYRNVRLYLSHLIMDEKSTNLKQPYGNESDRLNAVKSFPSVLLNFQYRETFESIGRIFEPQLNLGIEF